MTFELSKGLQIEDLAETQTYFPFDHLTIGAEECQPPGEFWYPSGVAIDPATDHIYVAEGSGEDYARLSIFSESGDYLNSYIHEDMKSLYGIAIHGKNLYVTDYVVHVVFHLKIEADFRLVAKLGSRGSGIGQFDHPYQVCISTINGDLYIADCENNRIQILDSSLHPIREVTHPSMHEPCDVKWTLEELYVLTYIDSTCVHVFTHSGHKTHSIITCGKGMQVTRPFYFALDTKNNFIISDWGFNQIKIFSNEGNLIYTLGGYGNQVGNFDDLRGLALTSNLSLVCVNSKYDNVPVLQIFSQ